MDMNTCVNTDFSTDTPKMIAVLKIPQILMNELPSENGATKSIYYTITLKCSICLKKRLTWRN